jgi:membrane-associated phospholipid phosphatase
MNLFIRKTKSIITLTKCKFSLGFCLLFILSGWLAICSVFFLIVKKQLKRIKTLLIFTLFPVLLSSNLLYSQTDTTTKYVMQAQNFVNNKFSFKPFIIPAVLISYGIATRIAVPLRELDYNIANKAEKNYKHEIKADNYIQYAPYAAVYGLDFIGIKAKNNLLGRTFVIAASSIAAGLIVQTTKRTTLVKRPDGSDSHSFPSGHTATAFVGAHILYKEYKDVLPWIGYAGYGAALATGCMRITNKKHWFSDVVTGAGVGILSVELSYLLLPLWHKLLGKERKNENFTIIPLINNQQAALDLVYTF